MSNTQSEAYLGKCVGWGVNIDVASISRDSKSMQRQQKRFSSVD